MRVRVPCLFILLVTVLGCGDDDVTVDAAEDPGADVSMDAPRDTAADLARDVSTDRPADDGAGAPDADLGDPDWQPMPGMPTGCTLEWARHPERLLVNEWVSCGEGCEYLDRTPGYSRGINASGWWNGEEGFYSTNQWDSENESIERHRRIIVFASTERGALAAWRSDASPTGCFAGEVTVGDGAAVLQVLVFVGGQMADWFYYAPIDELGNLRTPTLKLHEELGGAASLQRPGVSSQLFAAEMQPRNALLLLKPDGEWEERPTGPGNPQRLTVVDDAAYFNSYYANAGFVSLAVARFGEPVQTLIEEEGRHILGAYATPEHLTWLRANGEPGRAAARTEIELWTSPTTSNPDELQPRFVRSLIPEFEPLDFTNQAGGGLHHTYFGPIIRLEDGVQMLRGPITFREGDDVGGTESYLWSSDEEVAIGSVFIDPGPDHMTVFRRARDAYRVAEE